MASSITVQQLNPLDWDGQQFKQLRGEHIRYIKNAYMAALPKSDDTVTVEIAIDQEGRCYGRRTTKQTFAVVPVNDNNQPRLQFLKFNRFWLNTQSDKALALTKVFSDVELTGSELSKINEYYHIAELPKTDETRALLDKH